MQYQAQVTVIAGAQARPLPWMSCWSKSVTGYQVSYGARNLKVVAKADTLRTQMDWMFWT